MAITVKHTKVSTVPDTADTSLVRPSDWNADHTLTGLGTMAEQNANNVSITGGSISGTTVSGYIPTADEGVPNGVATLDAGGTIPLSQIPASLQGGVSYQGTWNATTNSPTLTSGSGTKGYYYVVSVAGSTNLDGITNWNVGDWAIFNGTAWQKVDNTDAVTSVNGYTGTVVLTQSDIGGTVAIANGGTGQTTANAAFNALAPSQTGNTGKYLTTDGTNTSWATNAGGDVVGPSSSTDNALARFDGTTGKLIQNSAVIVNDAGTMSGVESLTFDGSVPATTPVGTFWYDSSTETLNFQQNNITQQVGEEILLYGKASAAINDSPLQIIYQTGVVGASGVITFAPTVAGITNSNLILGCATEPLATNAFGRITTYGTVHNITTNGTAYGETWADGDVIWYNPVTGNPTKTKPTAPNIKVQLGIITHAGNGGSGSFQVLLRTGSELGGTDSNVNITSPTAAQILTYDTTDSYWKNTSLASGTGISTSTNANGTLTVNNTGVTSAVAGTGISVSGSTGAVTVTNTAPDQTVAISSGTGISVTGTYPNFTVTNTAPSSGGTVTSVAATVPTGLSISGSPITSSGTLAITYTAGYSIPTTTSQGNWDTAYTQRLQWDGGSTNLVASTGRTSLGGTTVGQNFFTLTNPSAVTFPRMNADNSVSSLSASDFRTAIGAGTGNGTVTSVAATAGTGISVSGSPITSSGTLTITNTAPDQTVAISSGTGISVTGTYPNFTVTNSGVTSVNGSTGAVTVSGGQFFGSAATKAIAYNSNTIGENITVTAGNNGLSAGPITISTGFTVTVQTGAVWVIV